MATKIVNNVSDKLAKVNENFAVNMYDNGYMLEVGGRDKKGEYANAKIMCSTVEHLMALIGEVCQMERGW